jgi:hypothetical protein
MRSGFRFFSGSSFGPHFARSALYSAVARPTVWLDWRRGDGERS